MRIHILLASLLALSAFGALVPAASAETCVGPACARQTSGGWGDGSCDEGDGFSGRYTDTDVTVTLGRDTVRAYTYNGCAEYGGDDFFNWFYLNVMVISDGQMYLYGNVGWYAYEFGDSGSCYAYYFLWDAFTGSGSYGRPCNVGDVYPKPPVTPHVLP